MLRLSSWLQALDARREQRVDEEHASLRDRVDARDRMPGIRMFVFQLAKLGPQFRRALEHVPPGLEVMEHLQIVDVALHLLTQSIVGCRHARKQGITAVGRHDPGTQDGCHGRALAKGLIRVPAIGRTGRVVARVVQRDDFRLVGHVRREGVNRQRPEALREVDLVVESDVLVPENDHLVANQRVLDNFEFFCRQIPGKVDVPDFGANVPD